jgi:hypothetical protein
LVHARRKIPTQTHKDLEEDMKNKDVVFLFSVFRLMKIENKKIKKKKRKNKKAWEER